MTVFGVTPTGFVPKLLQDVLQDLSDDQKGAIDPNWDTSSDSVIGQTNGTFARQVALGWEALQNSNDGLDADKAEDDQLISLCKLTGTVPRAASYTTVVTTCNLDAGTLLLSGTHFANVAGLPLVRATPIADYTALTGGPQPVTFRAENTGPVSVVAGTLTVQNTPVTGWDSITNPLDGIAGLLADSNETLRPRRVVELSKSGKTTQKALRASLLALVVNGAQPVLSAQVFVNETDYTDVNGLLPHSIECIVHDSPAVANNVIAQVIWDGKSPGIPARGQIAAVATDSDGDTHAVSFSRPTAVPIYLTYNISIGAGYVGDAAFIASVVTAMRTGVESGSTVLVWTAQNAAQQSGVLNLASVKLGFAPAPAGSVDLLISARSLADFDSSRIVVNHV